MQNLPGSFIIYYGSGKGKTTSAIGLTIRAAGHEMRTSFIQFMKADVCGEHRALARMADLVEVRLMGSGFVFRKPPPPQAAKAAAEALAMVREHLTCGKFAMVVADEILAALSADLITMADVQALVEMRPPEVTLLMTGREAPQSLIDQADLVSRIEAVKHPYDQGLEARPGIEF